MASNPLVTRAVRLALTQARHQSWIRTSERVLKETAMAPKPQAWDLAQADVARRTATWEQQAAGEADDWASMTGTKASPHPWAKT